MEDMLIRDRLRNTNQCDVCESLTSQAVGFCSNCEQKFCQNHLDEHNRHYQKFQKKLHATVLFDEYMKAPHKYQKGKCAVHEQEIATHACRTCSKVFCTHCRIFTDCPVGNAVHAIFNIQDVADEKRAQMETELGVLSAHVSEIDRTKLEASNDRQRIVESDKKVKQEIKAAEEHQVKAIREQSRSLTMELSNQHTQELEHIEDFENSADRQKAMIEERKAADAEEMQHSFAADLLRKRKNAEPLHVTVKQYRPLPKSSTTLSTNENHHRFCLTLKAPAPKGLADYCHIICIANAMCWSQDGKMVICDKDGLLRATRKDDGDINMISGLNVHRGISITRHTTGYVLVEKVKPEREIHQKFAVYLLEDDFTPKRKIAHNEFIGCHSLSVSSHAASSKILVLTATKLCVFDEKGSHLCKTVLDFSARRISFESAAHTSLSSNPFALQLEPVAPYLHAVDVNAFVVCAPAKDCILRYNNLAAPICVWSVTSIERPSVIASDAMGYLYVSTYRGNSITVLSASSGIRLKELTHPQLNASIADISVHGNELAVCCREKGANLFRIVRKPDES